MDYKTPNKYRFDLHFPKSRFSRNFEDRLMLFANKLVEIGSAEKKTFETEVDKYLMQINEKQLAEKTIANQRTEMIRLFGLAKYDTGNVIVGNRIISLVENQDIPRFFKSLCNKFQYPNGIYKSHETIKVLEQNIKFKPAQYLIKLMRAGSKITRKTFTLTAKEVAHLVFNDIRVTVLNENPEKRIKLILSLRSKNMLCDSENKIVRYARDFLNYMTFANLLIKDKSFFFLNESEEKSLNYIQQDNEFFNDYSSVISNTGKVNKDKLNEADKNWMNFFTNIDIVKEIDFTTNIEAFEEKTLDLATDTNISTKVTTGYKLPKALKKIVDIEKQKEPYKKTLKDIGDEGEMIVYSLERERVQKIRPDLLGLVRRVSNDTSLGFDIQSILEDGTKKFIEVKTTKRNYTPKSFNSIAFFNISYNEWETARYHKENYYIFRVIIAKEKLSVFVIQNPVMQNTKGNVKIYPVMYRLVYTDKSGEFILENEIYQ